MFFSQLWNAKRDKDNKIGRNTQQRVKLFNLMPLFICPEFKTELKAHQKEIYTYFMSKKYGLHGIAAFT